MPDLLEGYLTPEQVAAQFAVLPATVKAWCARGRRGIKLRHLRGAHNRIYMLPAHVREFMAEVGATPSKPRTKSSPTVYRRRAEKTNRVEETQKRLAERGV
jgi:hypothetical protein